MIDVSFVDKLVIAGLAGSVIGLVPLPTGAASAPANSGPDTPIFKQLSEVQWTKMLPDLGDASPEMTMRAMIGRRWLRAGISL
jgi:hypothetical protein